MTDHPSSLRTRPMRERAAIINRNLRGRLDAILPLAMRETGFDMWIVLCQEDNPDPVFTTLIPMDTWCPILQILVFYDRGAAGVERINISGTNTHDLYDRPYRGQLEREQWPLLRKIVEERDPKRIGINTGAIQWAAGGLTHNLYKQLVDNLPARYAERMQSAEPLVTRWLATLTDEEIATFEEVVRLGRGIIAECYSRAAITPGVTTTTDLEWFYWQRSADLGVDIAFKPFFDVVRSNALKAEFGPADRAIRPGDLIHCDVGIRYLRLNSDHQEWAYVLQRGRDGRARGPSRAAGRGQSAAGHLHGRVSPRADGQSVAAPYPGARPARRGAQPAYLFSFPRAVPAPAGAAHRLAVGAGVQSGARRRGARIWQRVHHGALRVGAGS